MRSFETEQEFLDAVAQALPDDTHAGGLLSRAVIAGVREADVGARQGGPADAGGLNLRLKGWVLRNEDLPVIEALLDQRHGVLLIARGQDAPLFVLPFQLALRRLEARRKSSSVCHS